MWRAAFPDLLVGIEHGDDAAVYRLNDEQAIVATTDFFMPIVDDPFEFGRIAATNALSDVYAMGGRPLFALAIVGMPIGKLPNEVIRQILAGGESVCKAAGIPIAGGHSIDAPEPIYGLVGIGVVNPRKVKQNSGGQAGDHLILGKPLGVGIYSAALKKGLLSADQYASMIAATTQLNTAGADLADTAGVHAMTDITGFGLLGHLLEITRASKLSAQVELGRLPLLPGVERTGAGRPHHRRQRTQLGELRQRGADGRRHRRLAARPADRPADQRRAAGELHDGSPATRCSTPSAATALHTRRKSAGCRPAATLRSPPECRSPSRTFPPRATICALTCWPASPPAPRPFRRNTSTTRRAADCSRRSARNPNTRSAAPNRP